MTLLLSQRKEHRTTRRGFEKNSLSPSVAAIKIIDQHRPRLNQIICQNGKSGLPMLIILFLYKLAIVIYGSYMSIRIWRIPMELFNESRPIAFSMYNMLAFGLLGFGLQLSGSINDPAMLIIRTLCLSISTFCTILAIFMPKIRSLYQALSSSSSSSSGSSFGQGGNSSTLRSTDTAGGHNGTSSTKSHDYSLSARPRRQGSKGSSINNHSKSDDIEMTPKGGGSSNHSSKGSIQHDASSSLTVATEESYKAKIKSLKKELKKANKALNALQLTLLEYDHKYGNANNAQNNTQ